MKSPIGWRDHLLGLVLCAAYVGVLLASASAIGMARDEGMYVQAGESYGGWLAQLWNDPKAALEQEAIDRAFRVNREHPPLMKLLFGLGHLVHERWHLFPSESASFRFAGMLSAGLLLWVIYLFGARLFGRPAGLFAACAYALLPRPFYHAHLNAFDVPITLANTVVIYAYYRSLDSRRWGYGCGALFGLALLTKHNSWIVPGILAIHFACVAFVERRARKATGVRRMSLVPHALIGCFTIGPAIFLAGWPFLWHETFRRIGWYVGFHFHHEYYNMEYFGVNYFWPPFPMSYSWVMTLFTVPFTTLLLGVLGMIRELKALFVRVTAALRSAADGGAWERVDPKLTAVLLFGACLAPLVLITVPSTPIFGGTKHWFPAYPFLALFSGALFSALVDWVIQRWPRLVRVPGLSAITGAYLLAPGFVETAHSHPFGLSHYTAIAGGVPGAAELGMNRQFWGFTTRSLVPYFREVMPNGGTVYICDTIYSAWVMMMRDGILPENFRAIWDIAQADYAIVHHEKHFAEVDHQIWTTYGSVQPVHVLTYDGVPIISVYKNPRR